MALMVLALEEITGHLIDENYPLMKFFSQWETLPELRKIQMEKHG